tara:strand:+ start:1833 stop:2108 length:276 start_codon:yes stop_codon:yes gene_type:complete
MKNEIEFVGAKDGKIEFTLCDKVKNGKFVYGEEFSSKCPYRLARYMLKHNWDGRYLAMSSLHFASEYGFERNEGAEDLLKKAIDIFNRQSI